MNDQKRVENLGKNIKFVRNNICKMTQSKFSEAVNISVEQIQKIEQSSSLPSVPTLFAIAEFAKIPVDLLAKDDIESSEIFTLLFLIQEIEKYDKTILGKTLDMLMTVYESVRNLSSGE